MAAVDEFWEVVVAAFDDSSSIAWNRELDSLGVVMVVGGLSWLIIFDIALFFDELSLERPSIVVQQVQETSSGVCFESPYQSTKAVIEAMFSPLV